jgi:hypothetical protein
MKVVCCQVDVSASSWSLIQRSPTACGVSECDCEALIMMRTWHTRSCCDTEKESPNHYTPVTCRSKVTVWITLIVSKYTPHKYSRRERATFPRDIQKADTRQMQVQSSNIIYYILYTVKSECCGKVCRKHYLTAQNRMSSRIYCCTEFSNKDDVSRNSPTEMQLQIFWNDVFGIISLNMTIFYIL